MARQLACEPLATPPDLETVCHCALGVDMAAAELVAEAIDAASDFVVGLRPHFPLGRCTRTLRPCSERCLCESDPCGCCVLRGVPIEGLNPEIVEVLIDGEVVPSNTYSIISDPSGRKFLERFNIDGTPNRWPGCQRVTAPENAEGSFVVRVTTGYAPDTLVRNATAEVACHNLGPFLDGEGRVLPPDTTTVAGQGFVMSSRQFGDPTDHAQGEIANFHWVQRLIAWIDATGIGKEPRVWSPEIEHHFRNFVR